MKLYHVALYLFVCSSLWAQVSSTITITPTLDPIFQEAEQADGKVLFAFDVDDVLIVSTNQIFWAPNVPHVKPYHDAIKARYSKSEYYRIWGILRRNFHTKIVDPKVLDLLMLIKQKQAKVMGLSNADAGDWGPIKSMEDLRLQEIAQEGIRLKDSFSIKKYIKFYSLQNIVHEGRIPMYKQGVLFACKVPKGKVLQAFLRKIKWKPDKVIFVDDKIHNVESVRDFCQQAQIPFHGFHYTAIPMLAEQVPLNKQRVDLLFKILEEKGKWLKDEEVDAVLQGKMAE